MMGHMAVRVLGQRHDAVAVTRAPVSTSHPLASFVTPDRWIGGVDVLDPDAIERVLASSTADAVVNCVGIVKQLEEARDPIRSIEVNALFPHRLARSCSSHGTRVIHLGTDCVFSGRTGGYTEADLPDPHDLYGRSKLLGELADDEGLTLRTSIIGRQLVPGPGLLEWFLGTRSPRVSGYRRAIFSGLTTAALARVIEQVLVDHPRLTGVWHVASAPISKFDLLRSIASTFGIDTVVEPDDGFVCDRSLDGSAFVASTGITPPAWSAMIDDLRDDQENYR